MQVFDCMFPRLAIKVSNFEKTPNVDDYKIPNITTRINTLVMDGITSDAYSSASIYANRNIKTTYPYQYLVDHMESIGYQVSKEWLSWWCIYETMLLPRIRAEVETSYNKRLARSKTKTILSETYNYLSFHLADNFSAEVMNVFRKRLPMDIKTQTDWFAWGVASKYQTVDNSKWFTFVDGSDARNYNNLNNIRSWKNRVDINGKQMKVFCNDEGDQIEAAIRLALNCLEVNGHFFSRLPVTPSTSQLHLMFLAINYFDYAALVHSSIDDGMFLVCNGYKKTHSSIQKLLLSSEVINMESVVATDAFAAYLGYMTRFYEFVAQFRCDYYETYATTGKTADSPITTAIKDYHFDYIPNITMDKTA